MNREILLSGFYKCSNGKKTIYIDGKEVRGKWVYGYLYKVNNQFKIEDDYFSYFVMEETIGQYTNRLDKNNKKIFEGCRCKHYINKELIVCPVGVVEYLNDRYILRYNDNNYTDFMFIKQDDIEVIGNKFDNGELIC